MHPSPKHGVSEEGDLRLQVTVFSGTARHGKMLDFRTSRMQTAGFAPHMHPSPIRGGSASDHQSYLTLDFA
jgi:hypothetical protein